MALASVALAQARTLLNDDAASVWTDAALIPKLQIAHQELQTELWNSGSPVVRAESSLLAVAIAATDLGLTQPADMITPTKLFEYTTAGVYYGEMTEVFYIPLDIAQGATLEYWCWRGEKILFLGSTVARKVKIQYRKLITVPTLSTSDLGILFAELYCGPRVAALAAGSVGNADVLKTATDMAAANFAKVITANRGQQRPVSKP
jgi:hypothetical protein